MDILVVGGGTGTNAILPIFPPIARNITYIVPISDNGGSTSEILRILGGPAIGDARSRLVRLMPETPLRQLLAFRLPEDNIKARNDWTHIVEGRHAIWTEIPNHIKHMYRAFFIKVNSEILLRNRPGNEFEFGHASIGNLLLSGARIFFGSLDSAIELVLSTSRVDSRFSVIPAINTNFTHHIAALLEDGTTMVGQTEISHPAVPSREPSREPSVLEKLATEFEDAMPFNHPSLSASQISFTKEAPPLQSRIERVFYINPMGAEIRPKPSSRVLGAVACSQMIVYSVGSLYTSIIPVVLLQGFAVKLRHMPGAKILMLNGTEDRETTGMTPICHVRAVVRACIYSLGIESVLVDEDEYDWTEFVTHVIYPQGTDPSKLDCFNNKGIKLVECSVNKCNEYNLQDLQDCMHKISTEHTASTEASAVYL